MQSRIRDERERMKIKVERNFMYIRRNGEKNEPNKSMNVRGKKGELEV